MATIKRKPNGKIITKDGKVSCECCDINCDFTVYPSGEPNPNNFNFNTFEITKEEYYEYLKIKKIRVHLIANALEEIGSLDSNFGARIEFSINESLIFEPNLSNSKCFFTYFPVFQTIGTRSFVYEIPGGTEIITENYVQTIGIKLEVNLSNKNGYKVNYLFRVEPEVDSEYTNSDYFITPIDPTKITGYPNNISISFDENLLTVPKLYKGPKGFPMDENQYWIDYDSYRANTNIQITATTIND
jgi:hypothetical protein